MGISIDQISHRYVNKTQQAPAENKPVHKGERNFDDILISADRRQIEEKKITEDLAKNTMLQVGQETSSEKIEALKKAVSEGNYRIDADAVASKILLELGGE